MKRKDSQRENTPWVLLWVSLARVAVVAILIGLAVFTAPVAQAKTAPAEETRTLVPVGRAVGIKLFSRGVMVVGLSDVETEGGIRSPARDCGLKSGDIITNINSQAVNSIDQVSQLLQDLEGEEMSLRVTRGGRTLQLSGEAIRCSADGSYRLGAWIRDSMAGIGTVTFYDPETGTFAALGHGINDVDTGLLMPIASGGVMSAQITGIVPGGSGSPGELHGSFDLTRDVGTLSINTDRGVFGTVPAGLWRGEGMPVARRGQVKTGPATILANIQGDKVEEFQVEILRIYPAAMSESRNLMVQITDERLLEKTGGIVQGMSGSPILQNGRLVGAVTHVLLDDATRGYGILAETMLEMVEES